MDLTPTVDILEMTVFLVGALGLALSLVVLGMLGSDRRNLRRAGRNGINKRLVHGDIRNELSRTYKLLCYTVLALVLMTIPPPIRQSNAVTSRLITWMLLSWELIAFMNTTWGLRDRVKNLRDLRRLEVQAKGNEDGSNSN